ncbi:MAG: GNAT family N-acetyltransferase [Oligoflexia bacterium]|nr:GNAT family N-acetyltransferase [Oligoflexia bacterium]
MYGHALIECIGIKFLAEAQAERLRHGPGMEVLRYLSPRRWAGPPSFEFRLEVLVASEPVPEPAAAVIRAFPDEAVVIRSYERARPIDRSALFMPLLARAIPKKIERPSVRRIVDQRDLELVNRTHLGDDAVRAGILSEPRIRAFFIEREGQAIASGAIVMSELKIAYIADMFVVPGFRGQGYGRAILSALLAEAGDSGAEQAILLPSPQARKMKFYENAGFRLAGGLRVVHLLPRALSSILVVDRPST